MSNRQFESAFCIFRNNYLILHLLFILIINSKQAFAQDFHTDSVLLRQKTIAKNDSLGILVLQKVIATTKYLSNGQNRMTPIEGYIVISQYWLFWNNKSDSILIPVNFRHKILENNFNISSRKLQNKTNVIVLEYSETEDPTPLMSDTKRIFQIINLDAKHFIFNIYHPEITVKHHTVKISETEFIDEFDTYRQKYQLTFDENDNVKLIQTGSWVQKGEGSEFVKSKGMIPVQLYEFTHHPDGSIWYKKIKNQ